MDENSKLLQPSNLTIESYKSSILLRADDSHAGGTDKLNDLLARDLDRPTGGDNSLDQTKEIMESMFKADDR